MTSFYVLRHFGASEYLLERAVGFGGILMLIWTVIPSLFTIIGAKFAGPVFAALLAYFYVSKALDISVGARIFVVIGLPIVATFPVSALLMVVFRVL